MVPERATLRLLRLLRGLDDPADAPASAWTAAEWRDLISAAVRHGVAPFLAHRLAQTAPAGALPPDVARNLQDLRRRAAAGNLLLQREASGLLRRFAEHGIPVILLKGLHLAELVYGDLTLRPMADIDLLVRRGDFARVETLLADLGYQGPARDDERRRQYLERHFHVPYRGPAGSVVEIHWHLVPPFSPIALDIDAVWSRAERRMLAGVDVFLLSPLDLLVYLCLHATAEHQLGMGLRLVLDIDQAVRRYSGEVDWEQVVEVAAAWRAERFVFCGLWLAQTLFGADVPDAALDRLRTSPSLDRLTADLRAYLLTMEPVPAAPPVEMLQAALAAEGWRRRTFALLQSVFPAPRALRKTYARPRAPWVYVWYILRPADLVLRRGRHFAQMLFRTRRGRELYERQRLAARVRRGLTAAGVSETGQREPHERRAGRDGR
jgi:hypothetical protein